MRKDFEYEPFVDTAIPGLKYSDRPNLKRLMDFHRYLSLRLNLTMIDLSLNNDQ